MNVRASLETSSDERAVATAVQKMEGVAVRGGAQESRGGRCQLPHQAQQQEEEMVNAPC